MSILRGPRLDRALWTWRLSGKAGGTGTGFAVEYKTRRVETVGPTHPVPPPLPNPNLDCYIKSGRRGPKSYADPALRNPRMR